MPYQPFLIANQRTGLELDLEPWLLPADAYSQLLNFYLYQGRLYKRNGRTAFGEMVHHIKEEVLGVGGWLQGLGWFQDYWFAGSHEPFTNLPIVPGSVTISVGALVVTDDGVGSLGTADSLTGLSDYLLFGVPATGCTSGNNSLEFDLLLGVPGVGDPGSGVSGTIDYETGAWTLALLNPPPPGTQFLATYDYYPRLPILGLFNYINASGSEQLLAFNTRRANAFNPDTNTFFDLGSNDVWTGSDSDFPFLINWQEKAFICNGIDRLQIYDGNLMPMLIDLAGDGNNHVVGGCYIAQYKNRLIIFRPTVDGLNMNQQIIYSAPGSYTSWPGQNYLNADGGAWLIAGAWLKDDLIGFFERGIKKLVYLGDINLPFYWQGIVSTEGTVSPMSVMELEDEVVFQGITRIGGVDAYQINYLDDKIPNLILDMRQDLLKYSYSGMYENYNQVWIAYPSKNATEGNDTVAVINLEDSAWSLYDLPLTCFGYYEVHKDWLWHDFTYPWSQASFRWNERSLQAGFPILLAGDHDGRIWRLDDPDSSDTITASLKTGRVNPFIKEGKKARLGWLEMLVDTNPNVTATVSLYSDHNSAPYATYAVTFDDGKGQEKSWLKVPSGVSAQFHQMELIHTGAGGGLVLHALLPYFMEGGPVR